MNLVVNGDGLSPATVARVARGAAQVEPAIDGMARMADEHALVQRFLAEGRPVYGLTTALGAKVTQPLTSAELADYSRQTIRGRANAVGPPLPRDAARAVMLVRLNGLMRGGSGARPALASCLADWLDRDLVPVLPETGSIGAGDLCILAHLGLALIGEGECLVDGAPAPAADAIRTAGLAPFDPGPKDGLAICNASAVSAGLGALALHDIRRLCDLGLLATAMSFEGFRANLTPLDPRVTAARDQPGQRAAARRLLAFLDGSALFERGAARRLQDPISLRSAAPIYGCLIAALDFAGDALDAEINGSGDNPLVLLADEEIVSTGNFQTPLLALGFDTVALAAAGVAGSTVARAAKLLSERLSGLPAQLAAPGASAGLGPVLKAAEALMAEIRAHAQPVAPAPSLTAEGVEDQMTNAPLAARRLLRLADALRRLVAIEFLAAARAIDLAAPRVLGDTLRAARDAVRTLSPPLEADRPLGREIEAIAADLADNRGALPALLR